ncbi:MAG: hypothetical protein ACJ8KA_09555 [Sulfurifustis sp.]
MDAWRAFVTQSLSSPVLHILEGSAFQSTVRFMLESERSDIEQYYRQFENVTAPLSPALIYLRPADGFRFSRALAVHRGASWSQKVADYLSATQYGRRRGLEGVDGMYRFWQDYAEQCDALVTTSRLPNCIIDVAVGDEDRRLAEAVVYFRRMTLTANKAYQPFT